MRFQLPLNLNSGVHEHTEVCVFVCERERERVCMSEHINLM